MPESMNSHTADPIPLLAAVIAVDPSLMRLRGSTTEPCPAELIKAALKSRTAGLFLQASRKLSLSIDAQHERTLQLQATQVAAENLGAIRTFAAVAAKLNEAGIRFLLLKGAALSLSIYRNPALRFMTDIDILVRPEDAPEADRVLLSAGCRAGRPLVRRDFFPRYYYEQEYQIPGPPRCRLEVHAHLFRPLRYMQTVPVDGMWDDPTHAKLDDIDVMLPSNESMIIHLAAHSTIHGNVRLLWLYDIFRFAKDYADRIDWRLVQERAASWSLSLAVGRALKEAAELFDDADLRERVAGFSHHSAWRDRLVLAQAPRDSSHPLAHVAVGVLTAPGVRFRLGYLWAVIFPGRDHMAGVYPWRHPGWLGCAHAWRLARLPLRPLLNRATRFWTRLRQMMVENPAITG
jgi:hypothetical protein